MTNKTNKRVFKSDITADMSYKELKDALKNEKRKIIKADIKEIISNKIFAKVVFSICILLNLLFLTLAVLNYLGLLV
jgi:hypothetical protein